MSEMDFSRRGKAGHLGSAMTFPTLDPLSVPYRGKITKEFSVACATCPAWEQFPYERGTLFEGKIRHIGWSDKSSKWKCPSCVAKESNVKRKRK